MVKVDIRWPQKHDYEDMIEINNLAFGAKCTVDKLERLLAKDHIIGNVSVATNNGRVVGYLIYKLHKHKLEILNLAVHPRLSRQSIGTQLVDCLKEKLSKGNRHKISVMVSESNLAAQCFFRKMGFIATRIIPKVELGSVEDRYAMQFVSQTRTK